MSTSPLHKIEFHQALMRERGRYKISRADIGRHVGVAESVVKRWERGEAVPSRTQFKRLLTRLPRMAPFFPAWDDMAGRIVTGAADEDREYNAEEVKRLIPTINQLEKEPPDVFGVGLRRIREENGVTCDELGELLGLSGPAIAQWEREESCPVIPNLEKLFEVLPELKAGIETGAIRRPASQAIEVPNGGRGFPRAPTVDPTMPSFTPDPEPKHAPFVGHDLSEDEEGKYHKHEPVDERDYYGSLCGKPGEFIVCAICGAKMPSQLPPTSEKKIEKTEHVHVARRHLHCGGEVVWRLGNDEKMGTWVCAKCQRELGQMEVEEFSTAEHLAILFVRARIALDKAKAVEQAAQEALTNATTERRNAEQEVSDAYELLELAIKEAR